MAHAYKERLDYVSKKMAELEAALEREHIGTAKEILAVMKNALRGKRYLNRMVPGWGDQ